MVTLPHTKQKSLHHQKLKRQCKQFKHVVVFFVWFIRIAISVI